MKRIVWIIALAVAVVTFGAGTTKVGGSAKTKVGGSGKTNVSPVVVPPPSGFAFLAKNYWSTTTSGFTSPWTLDTTGAGLIVIVAGDYAGYLPTTFTDSNGNSYSAATSYGSNSGERIFYKYGPTTGASTTFTSNAVAGDTRGFYAVLVFSGGATGSIDQQSGNGDDSSGTDTRQPGSVTPTNNNQLVVTGIFSYQAGGSPTVDSGFTLGNAVARSGNIGMGGSAYKIQTTATAENPTWASSGIGGTGATTVIATFKSLP